MKRRAHSNGINVLKVDNEWVFGVNEIRREVVDYFKRHVECSDWERPKLDNAFLVSSFSMEEIELVVKESDGIRVPVRMSSILCSLSNFGILLNMR